MNNKGSSLTNWIFTIGLMLLFVVILQSQVLDNMNTIYNSTIETGLNTSALSELNTLKNSANEQIQGSEVSQSSDGLSLTSSWAVGKGIYNTLLSFINGSFINTLVIDILNLPPIVATTLTVLIWISFILIIIYIFMKVIP